MSLSCPRTKNQEVKLLYEHTQYQKYISCEVTPLTVDHHFIKQSYHWYANVQRKRCRYNNQSTSGVS